MMKKFFITITILAGLCIATVISSCDKQQQTKPMDYTVTCTLEEPLRHDSATLLVLEESYNKLRVCGVDKSANNTFTFKGQIDGPKVALIRWDNDSTQPFHFVLEQGNINIVIKADSWNASGSKQNNDYQRFVNQRNSIMNTRVATWQEYLKAAADKSLTREDELRMVRQDSLLNDSLQRMTVERINKGDAVGRIIRERFAGQLDQEHARLLD